VIRRKKMSQRTPEKLVGRLMELCNLTPNKLSYELPVHYREIDAVKEEIIERMK
jgi:hypothetical protein